MTWLQLIQKLSLLSDEQLRTDVTIRDDHDEYYPAVLSINPEDDVLDKDHPFIERDTHPR